MSTFSSCAFRLGRFDVCAIIFLFERRVIAILEGDSFFFQKTWGAQKQH